MRFSLVLSTFAVKIRGMKERYRRNRIYVDAEEQEKVREFRVFLGGAGIGSIIAECALRFGFETLTIVDGD